MITRTRTARRCVAVALFAPLLTLVVSFAHDLTVCRFTGAIVAPCACPSVTKDEPGREPPSTLSTNDCCDRRTIDKMPTAQTSATGPVLVPPSIVAVAPSLLPPVVVRTARPYALPWAIGPPILLRKTVLLI